MSATSLSYKLEIQDRGIIASNFPIPKDGYRIVSHRTHERGDRTQTH